MYSLLDERSEIKEIKGSIILNKSSIEKIILIMLALVTSAMKEKMNIF